jgi:4-hydroxy-3-methylbut-2-enyl diphosphate reductase
MKIRLAKNSGFCFGVKRAIQMALDQAETHSDIVTLGPIIHNPQMVKKLEENNVTSVDSIDEIEGRLTIIRSHGVPVETLAELKKRNIPVIDATCPYVAKLQQHAKKLCDDGYHVIVLGDKNHPEVIAVNSYVSGDSITVDSAERYPKEFHAKIGIVSQTTQTIEKLQELARVAVARCSEMRVMNTICKATSVRQDSTAKLAKASDLMIVIGGKNSSNTKKLASICEAVTKTYHIETAEELDLDILSSKSNIGITAGASTPDWIIINVYNKIINCLGLSVQPVSKVNEIPGYKEERNGL